MPQDNKTLARRVIEEVWNQRKLSLADELFAPNFTPHDPASPDFGHGPEAYKQQVTHYTTAFPDTRFTIDDIVSEGDKVAVRWTVHGTHRGKLGDIAPTGREVTVTGTDVFKISGGKVQEQWGNWDALGLMRQLGAVRPKTQTA